MATIPGLIVRLQSGFYTVQTDLGPLECHLRGRLKKAPRSGDIAALGDRVEVEFLYPPTLAALDERLRQACTPRRNAGPLLGDQ